jgi:hypothetical protein
MTPNAPAKVPGMGSIGESSQPAAVRFAEPADCREIAEVHIRTWQAAYQHAFPSEAASSCR